MKTYLVKLIVTETHFLHTKADNEAEAMKKAENYGVNSMDSHDTDVEAIFAQYVAKEE